MPVDNSAVQIAVLLGAGPRLSSAMRAKLRTLLKETFDLSQTKLTETPIASSIDLITLTESLMKHLEDSDLTNAGRGSELTVQGTVECDATMALCGGQQDDVIASCGAVPDLVNPISLCANMVKLQLDSRPRARSVPNFLVGSPAREYALRLGLCRGDLATERARATRDKYLGAVEGDGQDIALDRYVDTVGLIVVYKGQICVSSSSGGSILKDAGRVGPAAIFGCGAYAAGDAACVCSGFGEDITATQLARAVVHSDRYLADVLRGPWSQKLQMPAPYFGVVKASVTPDGVVFEWQHTTEGMVSGFARVSAAQQNCHFASSTEPQGGGVHM